MADKLIDHTWPHQALNAIILIDTEFCSLLDDSTCKHCFASFFCACAHHPCYSLDAHSLGTHLNAVKNVYH